MSKKPDWRRHWTWKPSKGVARFVGDGRRAGFMHAHRGGVPVLKTESSWRTINGVYFNTRWGYGAFLFRRVMK